jgi:hypothetical protein
MTRNDFVEQIIDSAKKFWKPYFGQLADENRLRLAGIEAEVRSVTQLFVQELWQLVTTHLDEVGEKTCRDCGCGKRRERRTSQVEIEVLGLKVRFDCPYYYCRHCKQGDSPVRRWLGKEAGGVSLQLERALTDLTSRLTFGDAVDTLMEQHGQEMDRTKAERVTYRVGDEALRYLDERRGKALETLGQEHHITGVKQITTTADGGGIPVGELQRPRPEEVTADTELTPVRKVPKGQRPIQAREARIVIAHEAHTVTERVVDCHIAPYKHTEFTGERMLATAIEAGLGDNTHVHGVFDMAKWIKGQFEEQFALHERTAIADIMHVTEYLTDAGRVMVGTENAKNWAMERKHKMLAGEADSVIKELKEHACDGSCLKDEDGVCLVHVAHRYLHNNRAYLNYPEILALELPVGSGEAESGIRHIIKKRMDVAGAWKEGNAIRVLALITIRASGWWEDFWQWREKRDVDSWWKRQRGELRPLFRGKRGKNENEAMEAANPAVVSQAV